MTVTLPRTEAALARDVSLREQLERLVAQTGTEHVRLAAVDDALARLAAGSYGLCVDCGAEIQLERLIALPQAARCITCQQRGERSRGTGHARR